MEKKDSMLISVGPTGIGYYVTLDRFPRRDSGEYARGGGAMVVADAAIVASEVAEAYSVCLITNDLGDSIESRRLRDHLSGRGIVFLEDSEDIHGVPFDSIWMERSTGSRSFVTTDYFPKQRHIRESLTKVHESSDTHGRNVYLYIDIELGSPPAAEALPCLEEMKLAPTVTLANLGDVADLPSMFTWLASRDFGSRIIFQASTDVSNLEDASILSRWDGRQEVILTLGRSGAILMSSGSTEKVAVTDEIPEGLTVGAGAVLSAALLRQMMAKNMSTLARSVIEAAVAEASSFVRCFSAGSLRESIRLW